MPFWLLAILMCILAVAVVREILGPMNAFRDETTARLDEIDSKLESIIEHLHIEDDDDLESIPEDKL